MLLPLSCAGCGAPGAALCHRCGARLRAAGPVEPPPGVDRCLALVEYEGAGRELVLALKYRNLRALVAAIGAALAVEVQQATGDRRGAVDVVTWAPTTARRRHERGFDQAQLVARSLARRLGRPVTRSLARRPGPAQTGRTRHERLDGPAFRCRGSVPARVLVVDDVITSGATIAAAARALREGGARHVLAVAVAHTPDPARRVLPRTEEGDDLAG